MQRASRHTACYNCRERKVGCDGKSPCSRCERHGQTCTYPNLRSKASSNSELIHYLESMNERLKQAEEQLALQQQVRCLSTDYTAMAGGVASIDVDQGFWDSFAVATPGQCGSQALDPFLDVADFEALTPTVEYSPDFSGSLMSLESVPAVASAACSQEFTRLHEIYYETFHLTFPMINRVRLMAQLNGDHSAEESLSLSYAMCAQALLVSPENSHLSDTYYRLARQSLEKAELEGSGADFLGLFALQSLILMAFYELRHGYIPRAGLSAAKAMRLIQMIDLHRMDNVSPPSDDQSSPSSPMSSLNPPEQEERRRTFWAAYSVDCLISVFLYDSTAMEEKEITTFLPSHEIQPPEDQKPARAVSLQNLLKERDLSFMSPFAVVSVMTTLFRRALTHMRTCRENRAENNACYDFWNRQRGLENTLLQITAALGCTRGIPPPLDPKLIFVGFLDQMILMCLHKAAADRAAATKLPLAVVMESEKRCTECAIELARLIRASATDCPFDSPAQRFNPFVMLCGYASSHRLAQSINQSDACGETLQAFEVLLQFLDHPERSLSRSSMELLASRFLDNFRIVRFA